MGTMAATSERWIDRLQFSSLFWPPPQDGQQKKRADEEPVDQKRLLEEPCKPKCVRPLLEYQRLSWSGFCQHALPREEADLILIDWLGYKCKCHIQIQRHPQKTYQISRQWQTICKRRQFTQGMTVKFGVMRILYALLNYHYVSTLISS